MLYSTRINQSDHVALTTVAMFGQQPSTISLGDHSISFGGATNRATFTAAYGLNGADTANRCGYAIAEANQLQYLRIRSFCELRDLTQLQGKRLSRALVELTGFIDIDRIPSSFQKELLQSVLVFLTRTLDAARMMTLRALSLHDVMLRHPETAAFILATEPKVKLIVHPATMMNQKLSVATVRAATARAMRSQVMYLESQIQVSY